MDNIRKDDYVQVTFEARVVKTYLSGALLVEPFDSPVPNIVTDPEWKIEVLESPIRVGDTVESRSTGGNYVVKGIVPNEGTVFLVLKDLKHGSLSVAKYANYVRKTD